MQSCITCLYVFLYLVTPIGVFHAAKRFSKQVCALLNKGKDSAEYREIFEKVADCSEIICSINISEKDIQEYVLPSDVRRDCGSSLIAGNSSIDDESDNEVEGAAGLLFVIITITAIVIDSSLLSSLLYTYVEHMFVHMNKYIRTYVYKHMNAYIHICIHICIGGGGSWSAIRMSTIV